MIKYMQMLVISTLAELKTRVDEKDGQSIYLKGATADDDGLQGFYDWDANATDTATDDKVVAATGVTRGRWIRRGSAARKPTVNTPVSGTITMQHIPGENGFHRTIFTLAAAQIPVTDAAATGSYGTLKLCDLAQLAFSTLGGRQNYTAFAEGAALTGAVGDAVFDIGVGSVAIGAAADGALATTSDDIVAEAAITLAGGTGTGTSVTGPGVAHDGTTTAGSFNLNWSGTAATIAPSSTIDVTGT